MLPISTAELELSRTEYLGIMNDTFTIERKERVDDGSGNLIDQTTSLGPYPCRIVDMRVNRPIEFAQGQQITAVMVLEFVIPISIDVRPNDVLISKGVRFEVVDDNNDRTDGLVQLVNVVKLN